MEFKKHGVLLAMIDALRSYGSWTGKTHVQKAMFLLQESGASSDFPFVLYKHGPYSFAIESEIEQMTSYSAVRIEPVAQYGVVLHPGVNAKLVRARAVLEPEVLCRIDAVAAFVRDRNVADLERLATAVWVRKREGLSEINAVASRVHELKPHISSSEAAVAAAESAEFFARDGSANPSDASQPVAVA